MIELRREPKGSQKPAPQRFSGSRRVVFDWREVIVAGRKLWACAVAEEDRQAAQEFVDSETAGQRCGAVLVDVEAPSKALRKPHETVSPDEWRKFYDLVPDEDRGVYQRGGRPVSPLPGWAEKVPPSVREHLKDGDWPLTWDLRHAFSVPPQEAPEPKPVAKSAHVIAAPVDVEAEPEPARVEAPADPAPSGDLSAYGTAKQLEQAIDIIADLYREGGDVSVKKAAHHLGKNNLPAMGDLKDPIMTLAKERAHG